MGIEDFLGDVAGALPTWYLGGHRTSWQRTRRSKMPPRDGIRAPAVPRTRNGGSQTLSFCAQCSRRRGRLRNESGQAAVEFALVVPILCVVIIAILHFGKVMNYWLDLNHVASEGARKAAVNSFASDAEADAYIRGRLETGELRTGGTTSIPAAGTVAVCPGGIRCR